MFAKSSSAGPPLLVDPWSAPWPARPACDCATKNRWRSALCMADMHGHAIDLPTQAERDSNRDAAFFALGEAFRSSGGLVSSDVSARLAEKQGAPVVGAARGPVFEDAAILAFDWRQATWIPMFQFVPGQTTLRPAVKKVFDEFDGSLDPWALALWFGSSNAWLDDARPVDVLGTDDANERVLVAARADRFVANG
jgi:hypothetical protein